MSSRFFKLLLAYQRIDEALRLKKANGANVLEILRLTMRRQALKARLRTIPLNRHSLGTV